MADTVSELANLLGSNIKETQQIKEDGFYNELAGFFQINPQDSIRIPDDYVTVTQKDIGAALILGHPVNGRLGESYTLGTVDLGGSTLVYAGHSNNTYIENFGSNILTDTDLSTVEITASDFVLDFRIQDGEWISKEIFYDSRDIQNFNSVSVSAIGDSTESLFYYISSDGLDWSSIDLGKSYSIPAGFNKLLLKVTNIYLAQWPTSFGSWGSIQYNDGYINELKLIYGNDFGTIIL